MRRANVSICMLSALALTLIGCGGGGANSVNNLTLGATRASIAYGETVTINWDTQGLNTSSNNGFERSNFADVPSGLPGSGSVTDQPAISTTYRMEVRAASGSVVSRSVSVSVAPSTKSFLVVGSSSTGDRTAALTLISEVTTTAPTASTTIPSPSASYDALVLCEGGTFGPTDQATVASWLTAGKGVIVVGGAGNQLATGDVNDSDTSSISGWFGGVSNCERQNVNRVARFEASQAQSGVERTVRDWTESSVQGRQLEWDPSYKITSISGSANAQTMDINGTDVTSWTFSSGTGRVYFLIGLTGPSATTNYTSATIREAFLSGVRWAARG